MFLAASGSAAAGSLDWRRRPCCPRLLSADGAMASAAALLSPLPHASLPALVHLRAERRVLLRHHRRAGHVERLVQILDERNRPPAHEAQAHVLPVVVGLVVHDGPALQHALACPCRPVFRRAAPAGSSPSRSASPRRTPAARAARPVPLKWISTGFLSWSRAPATAASARLSSSCKPGVFELESVHRASSSERMPLSVTRLRNDFSSGCSSVLAARAPAVPRRPSTVPATSPRRSRRRRPA